MDTHNKQQYGLFTGIVLPISLTFSLHRVLFKKKTCQQFFGDSFLHGYGGSKIFQIPALHT